MANSVTKTYTHTQVNISYTFDSRRFISDTGKSWMEYRYKTTGYEYITFNLSDIPAGSTVTSVSFNYTLNDLTYANGGATIRANGSEATNANLLEYLQGLSSFDDLQIRFRAYMSAAIYESEGGSTYWDWTTQNAITRVQSISLKVTYTEPENSTVSYGVDGSWQKCKVFYGVDGSWQECKAFYGVDNSWKEVK